MIDVLYYLAIMCIRLYKRMEFRILCLFSESIERSIRRKLKKIGIVLESPDECCSDSYQIPKNCKYDQVCRIKLRNKRAFTEVACRGYIALGESYVNGDFTFTHHENDITEFITRCLSNNLYRYYYNFWNSFLHSLEFDWINMQSSSRAWEVGRRHYDLGIAFQ